MTPFAPTDADLARIDRARAEAWLTAQGWERPCASERPWEWRHVERGTSAILAPSDWTQTPALWMELLLEAIAETHNLRGLALWSVLVQWQTPGTPDGV